jgi:uncharacterized protein (UPF0332 family)
MQSCSILMAHTTRYVLHSTIWRAALMVQPLAVHTMLSFYAATALLLTEDLTRSKHSGVLPAFREHFVKPGVFSAQDSEVYGKAFELRNTTDYEMVGKADEAQAHAILSDAESCVKRCEAFLQATGYLLKLILYRTSL